MTTFPFVPLVFDYSSDETIAERSKDFFYRMESRRTVRDYSPRKIPKAVIENAIRTAGTAPSGANMQPWHFVVVTRPETRKRIRKAAETEEHEFYTHRASKEWLDALAPLGTNEHKPFLESASCLIAIFLKKFSLFESLLVSAWITTNRCSSNIKKLPCTISLRCFSYTSPGVAPVAKPENPTSRATEQTKLKSKCR